MTIELFFSDQLEGLADKFSDLLCRENRERGNIFEAPVVIVPNGNVKKWLQLFLSVKDSILMNVNFQYLESGLWSMLASIDSQKKRPEMLDNDQFKVLMVHTLRNIDIKEPDLTPIFRYLSGKDVEKSPDHAAKLWQLAERLAHLFQEYEYHRTEMIRNWCNGTPARKSMERCQQHLYVAQKALKEKISNKTGRRLLSMMEYADEVFSRFPPHPERADLKKSVHFFGLSSISSFHLTLMGQLQSYYDIRIYMFNPCREFWEDIRSPREKQRVRTGAVEKQAIHSHEREQEELFHPDDNALLASWGKPGRESIRLLCGLTDYQFTACFSGEKSGSTVLRRVQNNILTLSSEANKTEKQNQDRSLQIIACPGIFREAETVYNSILRNLEQDGRLQLTDIAILVPDISKYKPVFDSVFNRRPRCLAYNLVDSHAEIESVYGQAILGILKLAAGRFSRKEVFDLILNPCFMKRWNLDFDEVQTWATWTEALQIFHSFDPEAKNAKGYPATRAYTWEQGLQRLRLSRILKVPASNEPDRFKHFRQLVPFDDLQTGDADLVEKFCMVIETIHNAVISLNMKKAGGARWRDVFFNACDQLIEIPEERKGDLAVQRALVHAFDRLKIYDHLQDEPWNSELDPDLIKEFILSNLRSISGGHGDYLTGGVTISALQPMRPIPFDIVYVMGMEEGIFPGRADTSALDLRLLKRRIGDVSLPERNRYLFLEMLMSVREKLYITYVSKDLQKDKTQQPCSVVNQLRRYMEQEILPDGQCFQVLEIPLHGSSPRYLHSDGSNDWTDAMVNYSLMDRLIYYRTTGLWEEFRENASTEDMEMIELFCPDFSFNPEKPMTSGGEVPTVTSKELRKFLEDPVKQSVQRHLGLYGEEETIEDMVLSEDEPFFSEYPVDYILKADPIKQWLDVLFLLKGPDKAMPGLEDVYNLTYDDFRRKGRTPDNVFAELDRNEIRSHVYELADTLKPILGQLRSAKEKYRAVLIGRQAYEYIPSDDCLPVIRFDPVSLNVQGWNCESEPTSCEVRLHGHLPWLWKDHGGTLHALILTGSGKPHRDVDKYILEPVIFYLMCLAGNNSSEWIGKGGIILHCAYREKIRAYAYKFDREQAVDYLKVLISDYLSEQIPAWLPFEKATGGKVKPHALEDAEINDLRRYDFMIQLEDEFIQVEDPTARIIKPKVPFESLNIARQRFTLFFCYT